MTENIVAEKYCPHCKTTKAARGFYKNRWQPDGLTPQCKACVRETDERLKTRRRFQAIKPLGTEKRCKPCDRTLPISMFTKSSTRASGLGPTCKECSRKRHKAYMTQERAREKAKRARDRYLNKIKGTEAGVLRNRKNSLSSKYGLTIDAYETILRAQGGACAICLQPPRSGSRKHLFVDHDHQTRTIRGLLCSPCNSILGRWKDSPEIADRAAAYLRKHRQLKLVV